MKTKRVLLTLALAALTATGAGATAKYVFYFIGDGMGMGHVQAADEYVRDVAGGEQMLMLRFPVAGQVRTYSASSPITDSAAAGTALSTGVKTRNGMIAMNPDTVSIQSISADFMAAGRAVGVLTAVAGDDATPSAFYGHAPHRSQSAEIGKYTPESGLRFLGAPMMRVMKDGDPTGWLDRMQQAGYGLYHTMDDLLATRTVPENVLMLAEHPYGEQLGYTLDATSDALTLQEMTEAALYVLQSDPDGFFMMCEGGNIDWAAHANDGAAVVKEIVNFQNSIDVAYRFYLQHPDETLIVVTADHDTGGMALGRADNQKKMQAALIDHQKISKDRFADLWRDRAKSGGVTWEEMRAFLEENLSLWHDITLTEKEEQEIRRSFDDTFVNHTAADEKTLYNDFNAFTQCVWNILNRHYGYGWTTPYHTGNYVPLYAIGAGSDLFRGCLNNIEIPMYILRAAGIPR